MKNYFDKIKGKYNEIFRKINIIKYPKKASSVLIILVPEQNTISGGILSLYSFYNEFLKLKKYHDSEVIISFWSFNNRNNFLKYTRFNNDVIIQDWETILDYFTKIHSLKLFIPEFYVEKFIGEFDEIWTENYKSKFLSIQDLHINILNQNNLLMPKTNVVDNLKKRFTNKITITLAHKQYANVDFFKKYNLPIHYLPAWLNHGKYFINTFKNKKNRILISPDNIKTDGNYYNKENLIRLLKEKLPHYEILVIKKLRYEQYKNLVSESKFMITLGEGLDGYFIEEVLCGGVSFAIYNDIFFTKEYKNVETVFSSFDEMVQKIVEKILYLDNASKYTLLNKQLLEIVEKDYNYDFYRKRIDDFFQGNFDFK